MNEELNSELSKIGRKLLDPKELPMGAIHRYVKDLYSFQHVCGEGTKETFEEFYARWEKETADEEFYARWEKETAERAERENRENRIEINEDFRSNGISFHIFKIQGMDLRCYFDEGTYGDYGDCTFEELLSKIKDETVKERIKKLI